MTDEIDDGGAAFPHQTAWHRDTHGMTLRDWFAGQALQIAWAALDAGHYEGGSKEIAGCAYQIADAMLAERKRRDDK